jgi:glycosyltransferase involved in cell wall biosynthesis
MTQTMATGRKPRVLQVVTDRDRRGAQVFATDLAPGLEALGATVHTVALADGDRASLPIEALGDRRMSVATLRALRREAKGFDVVLAHGSTTLAACAIGLAGTGVPFIYRQISDPVFWAGTWPRRARVAIFIRRAAGVVALSSETADLVAARYRLDRARLVVSPNAVPVATFAPPSATDRAARRAELDLPKDAVVVAYVGALAPEKGVDLAVQAIPALPPQARLVIAGDGPQAAGLQDLARRVGDGRVRFLGQSADPHRIYQVADVVVLPSRGGDSMPAALIEAGLCGLPTVTTPVGAITDVVIDADTGFVVGIDDQAALDAALGRLIESAELRGRLGRAARLHCVERFTIDAVAPTWLRTIHASMRHDTLAYDATVRHTSRARLDRWRACWARRARTIHGGDR